MHLKKGRIERLMDEDLFFMKKALDEAKEAMARGEVPVGAIVVKAGKIIGHGGNVKDTDPTAHAEIVAIRQAASHLGAWNLKGCTLYVTLEPCPMCAGAMVLARIDRLVYGASDPRTGACGTLYNIVQDQRLNHRCEIRKGLLAQESARLLWDFFEKRRS
ncbi:tRNA adenosine(34) deaminase TadA [Aminobacterium sp. UBA1031]|jgi:tRNA(adenine34) deaminase|uniref:tRNA adenosine(34) deaminase TadA n=2 Tax=Aminobacteriaceae TaxID=3029087 RepID=UPI00257C4036|nr:tRNA adenosine(34) deaminase TadA [Aminobacterium sp. UBA1031]